MDFLKLDELKANLVKLLEAKFELKKIEIIEKVEDKGSQTSFNLLIYSLLILLFIFANILFAIGIGHWIGQYWVGFMILFVFYILVLLICINQKEKITLFLKNKIKEKVEKHFL